MGFLISCFVISILDIRKIPNEKDHIQLDNTDLVAYKYHLVTKYYETDILFMPYDESLNTFPQHLQVSVEGVFIYFNANDVGVFRFLVFFVVLTFPSLFSY